LELIIGTAGTPLRLALAKHDAAIVLSALRRLRGRVLDGLTLLVLVPLLALFARASLARLPEDLRELGALVAASLLATVLGKALIERLWFHRSDGVLARHAQQPRDGIAFLVPLFLVGLAVGLGALAVLGLVDPGGMVLGVCSGLPAGMLFPFVREHVRRWWRRAAPKGLRSLTRTRPSPTRAAALSVGAGIICLLMPSRFHLDAIATGLYALAVILLTAPVDARVVRYMTLVGHGGAALLRHWLPIQLALTWPAALVLLIGQAWAFAGVLAVVAVALPVLTALRIFAYRALNRVIADWTVAIVIIAAAYGGLTAPPLGPIIIVGAIVSLARRGAGTRWLLA
jgi:hypothetical protein